MRTKAAFKYQFQNLLKLLGWSYLWAVVGIVVLPFIFSLILGQADDYSLSSYIPNGLTAIVLTIFVFVTGGMTYDGFKLFIQNGIGRKTYFRSKVYALALIIVLGEAINLVYGALYQRLIGKSGTRLFGLSVLYGDYFKNSAANLLAVLLITLLFIACVAVTGMVIGTILGLFSRRVQVLLIVGIPILMFILLIVLVVLNDQSSLKLTWLWQFLVFIIGVVNDNIHSGHLVVYAPMISGSVYIAVMLSIAYYLTLKLRVPR
ncbi:hypothetical protein FD04_GL002248 [Secundilactobacillus odoratitofui DSM 19909 = JCM 15043]|uniref:Uncharacterized protein n=1 Tax=Secundilactobacillus odoratitofui DSM 19909 = JCM 15043 TaxID=1423776 RepID=A0A0R1M6U4_9LACO|nr:hypothetical protein [Secundilactobacillus odoratitofui]KRK99431.1 hypothetical protein FD04_GL002248 [Secundilactobacillus odoratitofui DSM 19909 = JCM 15043]